MASISSRPARLPLDLIARRRSVLALLGAAATAALAVSVLRIGSGGAEAVRASEDHDAPMGGNPLGDLAVVAFFDYHCPDCKAAAPNLQRFVAGDRGVRLIYRDWPVIGPASVDAARLALAARYQDRYETAHDVLMGLKGRPKLVAQMREVLQNSGLDIDRLTTDAADRANEIDAQLARNASLGTELRLHGVPGYLVGGNRITSRFEVASFQDLAVRTRAAARH